MDIYSEIDAPTLRRMGEDYKVFQDSYFSTEEQKLKKAGRNSDAMLIISFLLYTVVFIANFCNVSLAVKIPLFIVASSLTFFLIWRLDELRNTSLMMEEDRKRQQDLKELGPAYQAIVREASITTDTVRMDALAEYWNELREEEWLRDNSEYRDRIDQEKARLREKLTTQEESVKPHKSSLDLDVLTS